MKMDPMHAAGGFVHHISTKCSSWKAVPSARRLKGDGNKELCRTCVSLLQRGKG